MGFIREPKDVDLFVEDRPLTAAEKRMLKAAIAKNKAAVSEARPRRAPTKSAVTGRRKIKAKATK